MTTSSPQPRWLSDEEQRAWRAYMASTQLVSDALDRQLQRDANMPHAYYSLLVWLSETPERRMRMTELAERSKITRSRLSHAIARLEENGWVRRESCPSDRRGQLAVLTDEGFEALATAAPGHVEAVRGAIFDRLSPEQIRQLGDICRTIAEGLQPEKGASADLPWLR
ncbi:MarR family winged helix-turn-helix transcriptional regulator [Streptomyces sp. MI02-7b]|uniref:MarR family winged helix-turn-helix transcriptional regulator n=1 Tax=Streptomyces sp. MI02-7b TaxID=462941 RepID=UPI0029BCBA4C|nr:MarR family transcriptional regulator [Streptomyces sp. MI02-7b]MDX3076111.1 MarR family transcriptional regulator [Streptomyces sp. MI02-7b]